MYMNHDLKKEWYCHYNKKRGKGLLQGKRSAGTPTREFSEPWIFWQYPSLYQGSLKEPHIINVSTPMTKQNKW